MKHSPILKVTYISIALLAVQPLYAMRKGRRDSTAMNGVSTPDVWTCMEDLVRYQNQRDRDDSDPVIDIQEGFMAGLLENFVHERDEPQLENQTRQSAPTSFPDARLHQQTRQ